MRLRSLLFLACALTLTSVVSAQSTTGTISGRVVDQQGLSLPGVSVAVASPNLQGVRLAVTSENGDYILALLPSGSYTVTFDLAGFQRVERQVNLAPTQVFPLEITMGLQAVSEVIQVVGRSSDVLTQTAQIATNFSQELLSTLPTNRDVRSVMLMAPGAHPSGPSGAISVAGSMSFENLFMVNGVSVSENLRGQPQDLVIEDAIQETTVATAGISAEFGRFGGGVVNVITKSGGNLFAGSLRETLTNDDWRALVPRREGDPYTGDSKIDDVVPTHEYTVGGPVIKDRLWFFHAGRLQSQTFNRQLVRTNIPYVFTDKSARYEAKLTYSLDSNHRVQGSYIKLNRDQTNNTFQPTLSLDLGSLEDRQLPEDLFTLGYTGGLTSTFFVEGRYSQRNLTFAGSGSKFTDLQKGTLLVDITGERYNAATFCGVCTPEERDNQDIFVKGTYFLSTGGAGSHTLAAGYDLFNDKRFVNNFQSGSNYRFLNAPAVIEGTNVIATIRSGTTEIQWNPIFIESKGANYRTHSVFFNDNWRVNDKLTANLGVRWDRNDGRNSSEVLVAKDGGVSPRLGVVFDPTGEGRWSVTGSVAKYVASVLSSIAELSSPAGFSDTYRFVYRGPDINMNPATRVPNEVAIQQVFDWYFANGGATLPLSGNATVRGVSPRIVGSLKSPNVMEYAGGISHQLGARAAFRADYMYRDFKDFYVTRTDTLTGRATDTRSFAPPSVLGRQYDLSYIENDQGLLKRRYSGVTLQGSYRFSSRFDLGANYTISRTWGNVDGENPVSGPIPDTSVQYPEYRQASWNYPEGDLSIDQRHRARVWATVSPWGGLTLSVLQSLESGIPYSASNQNGTTFNGVDVRPYVTNPGYLTPPTGQQTQYYFTARDAFRTEGQKRTDFAAMYTHPVGVGGGRRLDLFLQAHLINLFNQFQLCGCGGSVAFPLGGNLQSQTLDTSIRTNVSTPATYLAFNPFTTTPVEGVNWAKSPTFAKALNRFAYTTPRTFRMTFGVRF